MHPSRISVALFALSLFPLAAPAQDRALPEGAVLRLGYPRFAAPGHRVIALSPDGRLAAVSAEGGMVIWDVDQARIIHDHSSPQHEWAGAMAWSANGRMIAIVSVGVQSPYKPECLIRDVATGYSSWDGPRTIGTKSPVVSGVRFVANDRWLALVQAEVGFKDNRRYKKNWQVQLWSVASGKPETIWIVDQTKLDALGTGYDIAQITLSPSGERMAWLASQPASVKDARSAVFIQDTVSGKRLHTVKNLPRTDRIDLADEGDTLVLHPLRPAKVDRIITAQATVVNVSDGGIRFQCAYRLRPKPYAWNSIGFTRVDVNNAAVRFGDALLTPDEVGLISWDFKTGQKLAEYNEPFRLFTMSGNGKRIAVRDRMRFGVSDGPLASLSEPGALAREPFVHFLQDGRLVGSDATEERDGLSHVWSAKGKLLESRRLFSLPASYDEDSAHSSWDSRRLTMVGAFGGGVFATFDMAKSERLALIEPKAYPKRARISGDGKRVLVYELDKQGVLLRWFDARTGRELGGKLIPLDRPVALGAWDFVADWFAEDGSIFGYYRVSERRLTLVSCETKEAILTVRFNPSKESGHKWDYHSIGFDRLLWGRPISSSAEVPDKSVPEQFVWDRQGRMVRCFRTQVKAQRTLRYQMNLSPDGRLIAYYDYSDKVQQNWAIEFVDTVTGLPRGRIQVPQFYRFFALRNIDFAPDSLTFATSSGNSILLWDLAQPLAGKGAWVNSGSVKDAEALWEWLGDPDPAVSYRALWSLVAAPEPTLALLKARLKPAPGPDAQRVQELIKHLDNSVFSERDAAAKALLAMPATALPILRTARKTAASVEVCRRLDEVIAGLQARLESPAAFRSSLRELRALEVLERIGGDQARQQVAALAAGAGGTIVTFEAQLILSRWHKMP